MPKLIELDTPFLTEGAKLLARFHEAKQQEQRAMIEGDIDQRERAALAVWEAEQAIAKHKCHAADELLYKIRQAATIQTGALASILGLDAIESRISEVEDVLAELATRQKGGRYVRA